MTRKYSSTSVATTLSTALSAATTSMIVASGTGSALLGGISLAVGNVDQFALAIDPDTVNKEIVFATQVSTDTFTIVRGQAGTSAVTNTSGATVKHVLTGEDLTYFNNGVVNGTITAKGDLVVGTGSGTFTKLGIGTNNYVLTADSAQATGTKWAAVGDVTLTGTQTLTNKTLTAPIVTMSVNAQTGTTYTFVASDASALVTASNASAQTYTIPPNSSVAYAVGSQISIIQIGTGQPTIQGGAGVTVASTGATATAPKLRAQYSSATLIKVATDTWYVVGDIA